MFTETCGRCKKVFEKETVAAAKQALRMHKQRVHSKVTVGGKPKHDLRTKAGKAKAAAMAAPPTLTKKGETDKQTIETLCDVVLRLLVQIKSGG